MYTSGRADDISYGPFFSLRIWIFIVFERRLPGLFFPLSRTNLLFNINVLILSYLEEKDARDRRRLE